MAYIIHDTEADFITCKLCGTRYKKGDTDNDMCPQCYSVPFIFDSVGKEKEDIKDDTEKKVLDGIETMHLCVDNQMIIIKGYDIDLTPVDNMIEITSTVKYGCSLRCKKALKGGFNPNKLDYFIIYREGDTLNND